MIIEAEHLGFCVGVKNAVNTARLAIADCRAKGVPVYACGPIIHNAHITDALKADGLTIVTDIGEVPDGAALIVRSHGETAAFYEKAVAKSLTVVDTTCPYVGRIHRLVREAADAGNTVAIVGDREHPEVVGIKGWAGENAAVVDSREEAVLAAETAAEEGGALFVVAQTTFDRERFREIEDAFSEVSHRIRVTVNNTICNATENRQRAAKSLAQKVDIMLVIGDKNSSNTRKLFEIAKKGRNNTYFIENINDLPLKDIRVCNTIGITAGASTPERIIKEVITRMSEFKNDSNESNPMYEFMDEIDKALRLPRNGDIVTGEVIQVTEKDVIINIGCKKDGVIPRNEIVLEADQTLPGVFKEGDEVQAKVLKNDDGDGNILLSKKRVIVSEHWEDINLARDERSTLDVTVIKEVNGGVIAAFKEINGFIPMSQLSDRYVEKADEFIGQTLTVKVMRVEQKRNKVVFSHKAVLNEARQKRMMEIWDTIHVGDVIDGKVMRFTEYGAFVDIGGIDGLLHISEISWGKLRHPNEVLSLDQEIKVKVLSMNKEKEKISLGYKQNLPEPWSVIHEKFEVGQLISGKAVQVKEYGVFVELEPGLDGLVHISEIAFKRVNNISDEIEVGQTITAKILEIDQERKRISLSIKETLDREAEEARELAESFEEDAEEAAETVAEEAEEIVETIVETAEEVEEVAEAIAETVAEEVEEVAEAIAETVAEEAEEVAEAIAETVTEEAEEAEEAIADDEPAAEEVPAEESVEEEPAE
ncbi:MAG: bifunctional 4-hydroxy-3-methylbut-2-enyl diphosphate reductase/30S ribosomal protein S1 [Clostridiales Family XIII bacterium]|jgi:4-hydroxy-3-methylbut-2-enyl diphosphate reductase|nr:bifunctional 4-hydroxy-3-methylbut-2-enyl diphosphate reductase/30S ribosomal protein S1 [Clostridiales Family XIII bacterium]